MEVPPLKLGSSEKNTADITRSNRLLAVAASAMNQPKLPASHLLVKNLIYQCLAIDKSFACQLFKASFIGKPMT